ncbi:MAG: nucleotidyltransferase family protein [Bacillales bacterium]|nr:nucleotidyltransferase family protein [Bacillales bacterium]
MKIAGIIAEFNPFHYGHAYLIEKVKEEIKPDLTIVAMSPNFVMRGEPAIFDKMERTKIALNEGIDIVAEIPTVYAVQAADVFAFKGVQILNALGITDLCFGVENNEEEQIKEIAKVMTEKTYKKYLHDFLDEGNSFNSSSKKALLKINTEFEKIIVNPNNLLAIQYLIAIKEINPSIVPHFFLRAKTGYFDSIKKKTTIQSATALRELIVKRKFGKFFSYSVKNLTPHVKNDYLELIKYRILSSSSKELSEILGVTEGFENKLKNLEDIKNWDSLVNSLVSKRDRETKINRILIAVLLNIKKEESKLLTLDYIRILGFDSLGQTHLKTLRNDNLQIISNIKRDLPASLYREIDFTKIYSVPHHDQNLEIKEYSPIIKN